MDAPHLVSQALIVGAQRILTSNDPAIQSLYQQLKTLLLQRTPGLRAVVDVLEIDPADEDSQRIVQKQVGRTIGEADSELLTLANALQAALARDMDRAVGVDLDKLNISNDLRIAELDTLISCLLFSS